MNGLIGLSMLMLLSSFPVGASMGETHHNGQQWAQSLQPKAHGAINPSALSDIPRFESANPKETQLYQNGTFQNAINEALATEDFAKDLNDISKKRPRFKLDPKTDPLFAVPENAETKLKINPNPKTVPLEESFEKTCEEGGEEATYECHEDLQVSPQVPLKDLKITIDFNRLARINFNNALSHLKVNQQYNVDAESFRRTICPYFEPKDALTGQVFNIDCMRVQRYRMVDVPVKRWDNIGGDRVCVPYVTLQLEHDTYEGEDTEEWLSYCDGLEALVDEGVCHYAERICVQGPETRLINGYKVHKDCWRYKQRYHCQVVKDECAVLRAQGCYPLSSRCKEMREGRCWIYEQRYQCPKGNLGLSQVKSPHASAFCLTGDCQSTDYKANGELLEAISRLAFLKEVQDDLRANKHEMLAIFKGQDMRCTRNCVNFKDCCRRLKGWGISLGLSDCKEDEKELAQRREQHQCHQVGTYCAKKAFKKCISKKTSFCCFGSRLSRLLQEQGRAQLGVGWGAPDGPDCRGLTIEELSRLDLSNMNFSEVFEDVMRKYKQPDMQNLQRKTQQKIEQNLHQMTQNLERKTGIPQSGNLNADQNGL